MAATFAAVTGPVGAPVPPGSYRRVFVTVTFDNSYVAGGYPVTPANAGLTSILAADPCSTKLGRNVWWDPVASKLKVFASAATEIAGAVDLSADSVVVEFVGN